MNFNEQDEKEIVKFNQPKAIDSEPKFSLSSSLHSPLICGINYVCGRFSNPFHHNFLVGLPAYFSNHSALSSIITGHRWDFTCV